MNEREELQALRRMAELEARALPPAPSAPPKPLGPPEPLSFAERNIAPLLEKIVGANPQGSAVGRVVQGAADPMIGLTQLAANLTPAGPAVNKRITDLEKQYQSQRAEAGSTGFDPLRLTGNIGTGFMAPGGPIASQGVTLANVLRGAGMGAAFAGTQPVTNAGERNLTSLVTGEEPASFWKEKGKQLLIGGGSGALGVPVSAALARILRPQTGEAARKLLDEDTNLTAGQILGGGFKRTEDALTSVPILGDFIKNAQRRSIADMNRAAYQRALEPIGESAKGLPIGPEGVRAVKEKLGAAYDELLPKLSFDVRTIAPDLANLRRMAATGGLPKKELAQFDAILKRNLGQMPGGKADGQTFKEITSNLGKEAKSFSASTDTYQQKLGEALSEAQAAFRKGLKLSNPQQAYRLRAIDEGYANYARIRGAAASAGDKSSGFTGPQLAAAVRAQDKSVEKGATATGQALMQDLSDAARQVLPSSVPDSGSPFRHIMQMLAGSGGALAGGNAAFPGLASAALGPAALTAGAGALMTLPYTRLGQKAARYVLAERPEAAKELALLLRQGGPLIGAAGAPALIEGP